MLERISGAISRQVDQYEKTLGALDRQEKLCEEPGQNLLIDEAYARLKPTDNVANIPVINLMQGKVADAKSGQDLSKAEKLNQSILSLQERVGGKNNPDGLATLEDIASLQKKQNHKEQYKRTLANIDQVVLNTPLSMDRHDKPANLFLALNKIYQHHLNDKDPQTRTDLLERQLYLIDNLTNYKFGGIGSKLDVALRSSLIVDYAAQERYKDMERIGKELLQNSNELDPKIKLTFLSYVLQSLTAQNKTQEAESYKKQIAEGLKEYKKANSPDRPGELEEPTPPEK